MMTAMMMTMAIIVSKSTAGRVIPLQELHMVPTMMKNANKIKVKVKVRVKAKAKVVVKEGQD